jgi:hypothetical protein
MVDPLFDQHKRVILNKLTIVNCVCYDDTSTHLNEVRAILQENFVYKTIDVSKQDGLHAFVTAMRRDGFNVNRILSETYSSALSCAIRTNNQLLFDVS